MYSQCPFFIFLRNDYATIFFDENLQNFPFFLVMFQPDHKTCGWRATSINTVTEDTGLEGPLDFVKDPSWTSCYGFVW